MTHIALGNVPGFDKALAYVRGKIAEFNHLGRVELPALRITVQNVMHAASAAGDVDLAARARYEFDELTRMQRDWELHNETLQSVLAPLRQVGLTLGLPTLPAWAIAAIIGLAAGIAGMLALRDDVTASIVGIYEEAVRRGVMSPEDAAKALRQFREEQDDAISWPVAIALVAAVGAAMWFIPRRSSAAA